MIVIRAWKSDKGDSVTHWRGAFLFGFIPLAVWVKSKNYVNKDKFTDVMDANKELREENEKLLEENRKLQYYIHVGTWNA